MFAKGQQQLIRRYECHGSIFSILQTLIQLSYESLTISYSSSFQPLRLLSIITWELLLKATFKISIISVSLLAKPEPRPPRANELLIRSGNPISLLYSSASSLLLTTLLGAQYILQFLLKYS